MIPHVLLSLMLASPPAVVNAETVKTYDLGKMTWAEAKWLDGKTVRVSFDVTGWSIPFLNDKRGFHVGVKSTDPVFRRCYIKAENMPGSIGKGKRLTVEGKVSATYDPPALTAGEMISRLDKIEVKDARPVRP